VEEYQVFIDCVLRGEKPFADGRVGRASIIVPLVAERSIQLGGQPVLLSELH
jgi:hypothetical protein